MNSTFSLRRIALYARKHYVENARQYLYGIVGTILLLLSIPLFFGVLFGSRRLDVLSALLMAAFVYYITFISCRNRSQSEELSSTLPVTPLEKYLFIWFNSSIVSIALYALIQLPFAFDIGMPLLRISNEGGASLMLIFTVQAAILLACCWAKGNPAKILLTLTGAFILFYGAYYAFMAGVIGIFPDVPFSKAYTWINSDKAILTCPLPVRLPALAGYAVLLLYWVPVCWVVAYFKFKERTLK